MDRRGDAVRNPSWYGGRAGDRVDVLNDRCGPGPRPRGTRVYYIACRVYIFIYAPVSLPIINPLQLLLPSRYTIHHSQPASAAAAKKFSRIRQRRGCAGSCCRVTLLHVVTLSRRRRRRCLSGIISGSNLRRVLNRRRRPVKSHRRAAPVNVVRFEEPASRSSCYTILCHSVEFSRMNR